MESRKNANNDNMSLRDDQLEGFAAAEMADRGPKDIFNAGDSKSTNTASALPVEDEDLDDDDEDDDLEDDDLDLDDDAVEVAAADAGDAEITEDVTIEDEDDFDDDDELLDEEEEEDSTL